jgi:hypothetical protein
VSLRAWMAAVATITPRTHTIASSCSRHRFAPTVTPRGRRRRIQRLRSAGISPNAAARSATRR